MASYLAGEDDQTYSIQTPGGLVTRKKEGAFDAPGSEYSVAKSLREQQMAQPSGFDNFMSNVAAPVVKAIPFAGGLMSTQTPVTQPQATAAPVATPTATPPPATPVSADPIRQPSARPMVGPPAGFAGSGGPSTVKLSTDQQITERPIIDQNAMAAYEGQQRAIGDAMNKRAQAESSIAGLRGEAATQQARLKDEMVATREAGAAKAEQQFNEYQSKYDQLYKDYSETKIQPKGYFEGDLGSNIMAGIGIMLGAVGGSLQGSNRNMAVEVMDRAIDRDIEAQKANLAKKGEALNMLGVRYQAARQAGFDDIQAKMLAKADAYDSIAAYTEAKVAPLQGTVIQQNGMMEAAKLKADAARFKVEATKATEKTVHTTEEKPLDKSGPKPEKLPEDDAKRAAGHERAHFAIQSLRELAEIQNAQETGFVDGRITELKNKYGLQNTDETKIAQKIKTMTLERVKDLTGAGSSENEREEIAKTMPRLIDDKESFMAKLDELDETNARNYFLIKDAYENPAGRKYRDLQSPGAERARISIYGKPSTARPIGK